MSTSTRDDSITGELVTLGDGRYYRIGNVDRMPPFLVSLISAGDHWLFIASNGGLTAGRVSPDTALFPYVTVDKIYDSLHHTGCMTLLRVERDGRQQDWEPFNEAHDGRYATTRNLYKSVLGNELLLEEINHDLSLAFRCLWQTSDRYGFVRRSELENTGDSDCRIELVDGLQNLLPAGTPRFTQTNLSYLADAYKWTELDEGTGLAMFTLYSGISDRAEPCESLRATTVFCLGLDERRVLLSSRRLDAFRRGSALEQELHTRGVRGAYFVNASLALAAGSRSTWQLVADVEQSQVDVVALIHELQAPQALAGAIARSVAQGREALARIIAAADGFQASAEDNVAASHYANVLFNVLRGGIVDDQYRISTQDFRGHLRRFNRKVWQRHRALLEALPAQLAFGELFSIIGQQDDPQLLRLACEYLPITFGRRHGDPSRPWNQFEIRLTDEQGNRLLAYQGNWRDIFQNWEALLFSYPHFVDNVIAKFVNASTVDGYNPYRISQEGIDWEVEDPEDPWSYIGYWGDHQIIYLLKLLELSRRCQPARLGELLHRPLFSYANVPYRFRPFDALLSNAKSTVDYDEALAARIEERVAELGADGRCLLDEHGEVLRVNLLEKLLVPLLGKLGNLVFDGGIWLNTQRPEWNDANNALVGYGLSMVTLCYLRRYVRFLQELLADQTGVASLSSEVAQWLADTAATLRTARDELDNGAVDGPQRYRLLVALGEAASRYRQTVYARGSLSGVVERDLELVSGLLDDALVAIDHSIRTNRRDDGLYHAYNLLDLRLGAVEVHRLYPMLEGQVAALSSGVVGPDEAVSLLDALYASPLYRPDQKSFLLYPDRELPGFLDRNRVAAERVEKLPLLQQMLDRSDARIIERDAGGTYRFNAAFANVGDLEACLDRLAPDYGEAVETARGPLQALYEEVFDHRSFTGRSGGMFAFEGLGSIYWHMVAKLLLAVQENYFDARTQGAAEVTCRRLGEHYYRLREGLNFNKTPAEYGAFPTDPYSHTPAHAGAQQPGMTGQVKEQVLTRFGELGVLVQDGAVRFEPALLRAREFAAAPQPFRYLDVDGAWCELTVPAGGLAFTWCQVPIVYRLDDDADPGLSVTLEGGESLTLAELALPGELAEAVFSRSGRVRRVELQVGRAQLFGD